MHGCVTPNNRTMTWPVCAAPPRAVTVIDDGYGAAAPSVPISGTAIGVLFTSAHATPANVANTITTIASAVALTPEIDIEPLANTSANRASGPRIRKRSELRHTSPLLSKTVKLTNPVLRFY